MAMLLFCPSAGRPAAADELLTSFRSTIRGPRTELLFVVRVDDPTGGAYPAGRTLVVAGGAGPGPTLAPALAPFTAGGWDAFGVVDDAHRFRAPGWDVAAAEAVARGDPSWFDGADRAGDGPGATVIAAAAVRSLGTLDPVPTAARLADVAARLDGPRAQLPAPPLVTRSPASPQRQDLVFASVGDRSVHRMWIDDSGRTFDLCLAYYEDGPDRYASDGEVYLRRSGTKLENFVSVYSDPALALDGYRYVLLLDDDIEIEARTIGRLFAIMADHDLWLAQPAYLPGSRTRWPTTRRDPSALLRYTNFVETGVTAFQREALSRVLVAMATSRSGWGVDMLYSQLLGDPMDRIAVVDAAPCRHPPREVGEMDRVMSRRDMQDEGHALLATWRDGRWLEPRILGRVDLDEQHADASPVARSDASPVARPRPPRPRVGDRRSGPLQRVLDIAASLRNPLFDPVWYRATYPDVPRRPGGARRHWRRHGWREERDPNPWFDTFWYLERYPDVAASGVDPLLHYYRHGAREGRRPSAGG